MALGPAYLCTWMVPRDVTCTASQEPEQGQPHGPSCPHYQFLLHTEASLLAPQSCSNPAWHVALSR